MWRDFGGKREAADADSAATAAREFAEETLGLFGAPGVDQVGEEGWDAFGASPWRRCKGGTQRWSRGLVLACLSCMPGEALSRAGASSCAHGRTHNSRSPQASVALAASAMEARLRDPRQAVKVGAASCLARVACCPVEGSTA